MSSVAGLVAGPITGFYNASKYALEALHESLAQEVKSFGLKVTLLEPGAYATGFASMSSLRIVPAIEAYANSRAEVFAAGAKLDFGDPEATAEAIMKIVDAEHPPAAVLCRDRRIAFGTRHLRGSARDLGSMEGCLGCSPG